MKKIFLIILLASQLSSLFASEVTLSDLIRFEERVQILLDQRMEFTGENSVETRFKKIHNFTNNYGHQLINELQQDRPLNGHQLAILRLAVGAYLQIADESFEKISELEPKDRLFNGSNRTLAWSVLYSQLIQDYKQTYELFYKNSSLRRVVKDQAKINGSKINKIIPVTKKILNKDKVKKLEQVLIDYQSNEEKSSNKNLKERLESTIIFQKVAQDKSIKEFYKYKSFGISVSDGLTNFSGRITGGISAGFGAVVGPIEWREGRLYKNEKAKVELLEKLRPLDLILEKKAFKLTDYTIPGYWGHIGVWLGTEKQLKEIGLWDSPIIKPFQEKIKQGYSIYEVRRWGLVWEKLETWMNLDEMAVVRHNSISNYGKTEYNKVFNELFSQIGKKYDYSFDAMTANTITCTEIISLSFGPINWPTTKVVGRHTLQPDNIAALTLYRDTPVEFVTYLRGTKSGYNFESKETFAKLIEFRKKKSDASQFEKHFRKCKRTRYRSNSRGGIRFQNQCWSEYESYQYQTPSNHLDEDEL